MEKWLYNTVFLVVVMEDFIAKFETLDIDANETNNTGRPGYEQLSTNLITVLENVDDNEIVPVEVQQPQCPISNTKAMIVW